MNRISLTDQELNSIKVGEAITLVTVLAIMTISVMAVVVYRLFTSKSSTIKIPGGWSFTWK
jgi:hypothetical protein